MFWVALIQLAQPRCRRSQYHWLLLCCFIVSLSGFSTSSLALDRKQADLIPHVNQRARDGFLEYIYSDTHKAYAIAPGGVWAWTAIEKSEAEAQRIALQQCQSHSQLQCVLYASNDKLVFDQKAWPRLWRLNKAALSAKPVTGVARGQMFPDLLFKDRKGKKRRIANFKAKLTLVHFWGSWCPPCMREMPGLLRLQQALKEKYGSKVKMVLLQVREPFSQSLKWAKRYEFDSLPLYDSGVKGETDNFFHTRDGKQLADRQVARAFPTSYVLDHKGRVLFVHTGPVADWLAYLPFFKDIVEND